LGAALLISSGERYSEREPRQRTAAGTIVNHEPGNHNRYGYRFEVGGRFYTGDETPRSQEPTIGDLVTVYYDSADPAENGLRPFANRRSALIGPACALLVLSGIIALLVLLLGPILTKANS
jgi:hypothetical protein